MRPRASRLASPRASPLACLQTISARGLLPPLAGLRPGLCASSPAYLTWWARPGRPRSGPSAHSMRCSPSPPSLRPRPPSLSPRALQRASATTHTGSKGPTRQSATSRPAGGRAARRTLTSRARRRTAPRVRRALGFSTAGPTGRTTHASRAVAAAATAGRRRASATARRVTRARRTEGSPASSHLSCSCHLPVPTATRHLERTALLWSHAAHTLRGCSCHHRVSTWVATPTRLLCHVARPCRLCRLRHPISHRIPTTPGPASSHRGRTALRRTRPAAP